ncbi:MAG: alpha-1,2-fucosyltransferase [Thermoplasmata archaeon]
MIIFFNEGRLGNQLFQFAFLETIKRDNEKIIGIGFDELYEVFDVKDENFIAFHLGKGIQRKILWRLFFKVIRPFLYWLASNKIISSIEVDYEYFGEYRRESNTFKNIQGFLKQIILVKTGFFQSENFFSKDVIKKLKIKDKHVERARNFLSHIENFYKIAVHIRLSDYRNFYVFGHNPVLPVEYYHRLIKWFLENREKPFFVFVSDDPDFVEKEFCYLQNKLVSKNDYATDFAIITLCDAAILSPSSFSWWGSYMMKKRDIVFAPKYWLGWKVKIDYHKNPLAYYMEPVDISELEVSK